MRLFRRRKKPKSGNDQGKNTEVRIQEKGYVLQAHEQILNAPFLKSAAAGLSAVMHQSVCPPPLHRGLRAPSVVLSPATILPALTLTSVRC
jgi:hypothetical protein